MPIDTERIEGAFVRIFNYLRGNSEGNTQSELIAASNDVQSALLALNILASIPETKAILRAILFPEIEARLAKVEKELSDMRGDNR